MSLSASEAAPIYSALGADPDLADLVDLFVEEIPGRVRAMEEALRELDWDLLRTLTHQMSGAGGSYGFPGLTPCARNLENAAGAQNELAASAALEAFATVCRRLRAGAPKPAAPQGSGVQNSVFAPRGAALPDLPSAKN
jgi:HPt (histidine-containing phosphotransfer) domain-containing protein